MVSVVITTYGGDKKLVRAIKSVLMQSYEKCEIIVVDDNDPDTIARIETEKMMDQFSGNENVIYVQHKNNKNGAAARNTGLSVAKGKYIAFLDDDDIFLLNRVKNAVSFLEENKNIIGVLYGVASIRDGKLVRINKYYNGEELTALKILGNINSSIGSGSNIFILTEIAKVIRGFDEEFQRFQDIEFMLRVCEKGKIVYQNDIEIVKEETEVRNLNYEKVRYAYILLRAKFKERLYELDIKKRNKLEASVKKYKLILYLEKLMPHFLRFLRYLKHCKSDYFCSKELSKIEYNYIFDTWKYLNR